MPSCEDYRAQISCLIDGELSDEEAAALLDHMETCETCKTVYDSFRFIASALSDELAEPPENLAASVMEKIRETPRIQKKNGPKILFLRYGAMAACLALVLLGAARLNLFPKSKTALQAPAAAENASASIYAAQKGADTAPAATQAPGLAPAPAELPPITAGDGQWDDVVTTAGTGVEEKDTVKSGESEEKFGNVIMGVAPENSAVAESLSASQADAFLAELRVKNVVAKTGLPDAEPEIVLLGETTQGEAFIVYVYNTEAEPMAFVNLNGENVLFTGDIEPYLTPQS